jgi:hypothetical protein
MRQTAIMAAIVTSLMYFSAGALLAVASYVLFGVSLHAFVTFGDSFGVFAGLLAWWVVGFVPAYVYAAVLLHPGLAT